MRWPLPAAKLHMLVCQRALLCLRLPCPLARCLSSAAWLASSQWPTHGERGAPSSQEGELNGRSANLSSTLPLPFLQPCGAAPAGCAALGLLRFFACGHRISAVGARKLRLRSSRQRKESKEAKNSMNNATAGEPDNQRNKGQKNKRSRSEAKRRRKKRRTQMRQRGNASSGLLALRKRGHDDGSDEDTRLRCA
jgi:hypothetical protein